MEQKMEIMRHVDQDNIMSLYDASMRGCVITLNELVQKDQLILHKLSLTSLSETPLHIASLMGHLDFTRALLSLKPKLATELDSSQRSPLHLASAEGHTDVVKMLLETLANHSNYCCLVQDEDGRIPLHLAAMRGRVDAMDELIKACPNSMKVLLHGESVLHLCVRYNHLEALKLLVNKLGNEQEFLNSIDMDGNTILHLAVKLNQIETVKYLVSVPEIKANANVRDVIDKSTKPRDFKSLQIQGILMDQAVVANKCQRNFTPPRKGAAPPPPPPPPPPDHRPAWCLPLMSKKLKQFMKYKNEWVDEAHGYFLVVATVIATVSFGAAINPPGGVWQEDTTKGDSCKVEPCLAGTAVLSYGEFAAWEYKLFYIYNTISFLASLSVILLHFAGFGLKNRLGMWLFTVTMCTTLTFMVLTYLQALLLLAPFSEYAYVWDTCRKGTIAWLTLLGIVGVFHTTRFFYWLLCEKTTKCGRNQKSCWQRNSNSPVEA